MSNPIPENEPLRLQALEDLRILDTERQADFDALVSLARQIFDVPISLISLLDRDRQWFKAVVGLDINQTERAAAFCNYTISGGDAFVVSDASEDQRFCANRLVSADPNVRFYAGVPLAVEPGLYLGSFCILDRRPRQIDDVDLRRLKWLGEIAVSLLRKHKTALDSADLSASVAHQAEIISEQTAALIEQKRILNCASSLAKMGAWEMDIQTGEWKWSDGMYELHEVERGFHITFDRILNLYPEPYRTRLARLMEQSQRGATPFTFEGRMYTEKGNLRWVRIISDFECKDGRPIRRFGMKQDITDEKTMALRIQRLAQRDDLTGLYNRAVLYEKLAETANKKDPFRHHVTLFLCDLDGFKDINDTHGHPVGDVCLKRIAHRVRKLLGSGCLMARIGGDEFAILIHDDTTIPPIDDLVERVQRAVARPLRWKGHTFGLTCSIGIASRAEGRSFDPDELLREADLALYEAKAAGKNCRRLFRPALQAAVNERFAILLDVRRALAHHQLALHYQPKVRLHDGAHVGFEALLRLNKPDGTVLSPNSFMVALEDPALSMEVGEFVIAAAIDQAERWKQGGVPFNHIAINLSASQFRDPELAERMLSAIAARNLHSSMFEVEVTEGVFLSTASDSVLNACKKLKQGGVRIAFDDFGTGFASLTHLRDFPVDIIKIDRSFISCLGQGGTTTAIVNAMVGLARNLSMCVVAEGVETRMQADFLNSIGCNHAQGYLFGRPQEAAVAVQYLEEVRDQRRTA
jgi:diguanylate cyclase (GGDEF)-like protein